MPLFLGADFTYSYAVGSNAGKKHVSFHGFIQSFHGNVETVRSEGAATLSFKIFCHTAIVCRPKSILDWLSVLKQPNEQQSSKENEVHLFLLVDYRKRKKEQLYSIVNMLLSLLCIYRLKAIPVLNCHTMKASGQWKQSSMHSKTRQAAQHRTGENTTHKPKHTWASRRLV
jgi:hypothetical protein